MCTKKLALNRGDLHESAHSCPPKEGRIEHLQRHFSRTGTNWLLRYAFHSVYVGNFC